MNELEVIVKVINTLSQNAKCKERYASELDNFHNRKTQAESNRYRLGVIGVTSCGKSTMINSLLGEFLLPAVARPSSSQLVSCFWSKTRCAKIYFQDKTPMTFTGNSLSQKLIEKYGDEKANERNKEKVKQIELSTPDFPFDERIILIDSPGLDAYGYAGHEQLTMNSLLPTIDFCIFVTTCKTNSDEKMLSVLNTIAEYEKPVIIVQNMIDSLKPGLEGQTVSEVAQVHRKRVERIINRSNIKDKSKVHIVQISAIEALQARQNKLRTKADEHLLEKSNYEKLVSVVNTAFNQVRPVVEGHRMMFLKKEILRIAKAAIEDGAGAQGIIEKFQYENTASEYERSRGACINRINKELNNLQSRLSSISNKRNFTEYDILKIKEEVKDCEDVICQQMKLLNESIIYICEKLNIDSRNIITDFRFNKPELHLKKKKEVIREGHWEKGKRLWYTLWLARENVWIDPIIEDVTDVEGTIQNAINYINNSTRVFRQTIERWQNSIEITENKLYAEIDNRRTEYEARRNKALDCQVYKQIGVDLQRIAESINDLRESYSPINSTHTDVKESATCKIRVSKELLPMYRLSEIVRLRIQNDTFRFFTTTASHQIIIGWDEYCESKFLRYAFNENINPSKIAQGNNILGNSRYLIHKPNGPAQFANSPQKSVFVLVNATQFGSAMSEIARFKLSNMLNSNSTLYFVVQDFNEIMNGNSVSETLDNIIGIKQKRELNIRCTCKYLLLHDNPIYNLAAVEAQAIGCTTQFDETAIFDKLQKRFNYLLPQDKSMRNITEATIRIIIQKLGRT